MRKVLISAILSIAAGATWADTVFGGFTHGSETVNINLSSPLTPINESGSAGGLSTSVNGGASFESYCVDLYQTLSFGVSYSDYTAATATHVFANASAVADLSKLYVVAGLVNTSVQEAAFQIAIWEIAYETQGPYSLASGAATFTGGTADTSGALTLASTWLAGLGNVRAGLPVGVLDSPLQQDVIFAPIPEPSTVALLAFGLMGLAWAARRKAAGASLPF